jgi:hypothetical protein
VGRDTRPRRRPRHRAEEKREARAKAGPGDWGNASRTDFLDDVPQADHGYDMNDAGKARHTYALITRHVVQAAQPSAP